MLRISAHQWSMYHIIHLQFVTLYRDGGTLMWGLVRGEACGRVTLKEVMGVLASYFSLWFPVPWGKQLCWHASRIMCCFGYNFKSNKNNWPWTVISKTVSQSKPFLSASWLYQVFCHSNPKLMTRHAIGESTHYMLFSYVICMLGLVNNLALFHWYQLRHC